MFNFSMSPPQASNFAKFHDTLFYVLLILTVIFSVIVGVAVLFFAAKYRAGRVVDRSHPPHESKVLELTWSIIPTILGLIVFVFATMLFVDMRTPPKNASEIFVMGKQWMWHIQHANGIRENNTLTIPVNKPVKLTMISQDVIHAFYVPAFRVQYHVVPGRYTQMWFTPTEKGTYPIFCNVYCGTQHSEMGGYVRVLDQKEWNEWARSGGETSQRMTLEQMGARTWARLGCGNGNCHGTSNTERGPSLYGIYGTKRKLKGGGTAIADVEYLRESILQPYNKITEGYDNTMSAYEGQLSEEEIMSLIAYIRSLGTSSQPTTEAVKGQSGGGEMKPSTPNLAVGALGADQYNRPGPDSGKLAAGVMGTKGN
jgi:cytochrome c oxidase subunit 2